MSTEEPVKKETGGLRGLYDFGKSKVKNAIKFFLPERQDFVDETQKIKEIRFEGRLYNVTSWIKNHPGGRVIEFYTRSDEDATEAIKQFHYRSSDRVMKMLKMFKSRPVPEGEVLADKEIKYEELSEDFDKLTQEFKEEGLFEPSMTFAVIRLLEIFLLGVANFLIAFFVEDFFLSTGICTLTLSLFMLRGAFILHEAGHYSITGSVAADRIVQSVVAGLCVGLSGSWWRSHHSRHHAMPQRMDRDVNINSLPFLAYDIKTVKGVKRSEKFPYSFLLRHQAKLFVPALSLGGFLGWKFWCGPKAAWAKKQYHELVLMALHYVLLGYFIGIFALAFATVIMGALLLLNFDTSHSHLPVIEEPHHWVEYGLVYTVNLNSSWFWDWWTGYINFQIEHHLFPTMPNFRLYKASERVKKLAEKHNLPYVTISYGKAIMLIFQNLHHVSKEVRGLEPRSV